MLIPLKMIDVATTQEALVEFMIFIEMNKQGLKHLGKSFFLSSWQPDFGLHNVLEIEVSLPIYQHINP